MSSHPPTPEDEQVMRGLKLFYKFLVALPWIWLGMLTLFVLTTAVSQNAWPSYGQPDPKTIPLLYWPTFLLFLATLASFPIWLIMTLFALRPIFPVVLEKQTIVIYLVGLALFFLLIITDAGGLITWLID